MGGHSRGRLGSRGDDNDNNKYNMHDIYITVVNDVRYQFSVRLVVE